MKFIILAFKNTVPQNIGYLYNLILKPLSENMIIHLSH